MAMSEPRIIFITSGHNPLSSRLFHKELKSLRKFYRDLSIIAPYEKPQDILHGITIYGVQKYRSRYNRWATLSALYRKSRELKPNIVHCHEPDSLFVAYLLKQKVTDLKVIYDCHEFHPQSFTEGFFRGFRGLTKWVIEKCENLLASRVNAVITVNDKLVRRFEECNKSVVLLPNYPRLSLFSGIERKREILSAEEIRLIYVGVLNVDRGVFSMLEMLKEINKSVSAQLLLIGRFASSELQKKFVERAKELRLTEKIVYRGYLSHNETVINLFDVDLGLCLLDGKERYHWTEPIKYFEYSAAGLPVIMSDLQEMNKLIEKNGNGVLVSPGSSAEAANAVKYLYENRNHSKNMADRGRRAFLEEYNWERIESRLLDLYAALIDRTG
jgi:glycosyltransferase involved in cell wall biosynthesis